METSGQYLRYSMYAIFDFSYRTPVQRYRLYYRSYTGEERLQMFFWDEDNSKEPWNAHKHSRTIGYISMTSASSCIYAEQYHFDGWVDNLEPTLICFVFRDTIWTKPLIHYPHTKKIVMKIELIIKFPNLGRRNHHVTNIFPNFCEDEYVQTAIYLPIVQCTF